MVSGGGGKLHGRETEVQNGRFGNPRDIQMTAGGRSYALRIVRGHRLGERYLTGRTSIKAVGWHNLANKCGRSLISNCAGESAEVVRISPACQGTVDPVRSAAGTQRSDPAGLHRDDPANEIVIPTVLMLTVVSPGTAGAGEGASACSTTIYTIY